MPALRVGVSELPFINVAVEVEIATVRNIKKIDLYITDKLALIRGDSLEKMQRLECG